jgi:hypothetical protein
MLAPCPGSINWTACLRAGEIPKLSDGTDANARDIRAASTLGCARQGLCFQLFEMEFMVNAN